MNKNIRLLTLWLFLIVFSYGIYLQLKNRPNLPSGHEAVVPEKATTEKKVIDPVQFEMKTFEAGPNKWPRGSRFEFPQVTLENKSIESQVNKLLKKKALSFGCDKPNAKDQSSLKEDQVDFDVKTEVTFAQEKILSLKIHFDLNCGGSYPDTFDEGLTLDLETGKSLSYNELFADFSKDWKAIRQLTLEEPMKSLEKECENFDLEDPFYGGEIHYNLVSAGPQVQVWTISSHAFRSCDLENSIEIAKLKSFRHPQGVLSRL